MQHPWRIVVVATRSNPREWFHDAPELLLAPYDADVAVLREAGYQVEPVGRVQPEFRRALPVS